MTNFNYDMIDNEKLLERILFKELIFTENFFIINKDWFAQIRYNESNVVVNPETKECYVVPLEVFSGRLYTKSKTSIEQFENDGFPTIQKDKNLDEKIIRTLVTYKGLSKIMQNYKL